MPSTNKKFTMTVLGLILIMVIFASCLVLLFFVPTLAASVVPFAQVVVTAISGMVAVYAGAQAAVDWKTATVPPMARTA